jgi:biopolymer transport protein ExbD
MAFKKLKRHKENVELVSLIDMIFILLVFFLVTSYVIRTSLEERSLYIPTPENTLGRTQILIQIIDGEKAFWLDETASAVVSSIEEEFGYLSPEGLRTRILNTLAENNVYSFERLQQAMQGLKSRAQRDPAARFFVLIRCPDEVPYASVLHLITFLMDTPYRNIRYGCVAGRLNDILQCKKIYTVTEDIGSRRLKNIRIDFQ